MNNENWEYSSLIEENEGKAIGLCYTTVEDAGEMDGTRSVKHNGRSK